MFIRRVRRAGVVTPVEGYTGNVQLGGVARGFSGGGVEFSSAPKPGEYPARFDYPTAEAMGHPSLNRFIGDTGLSSIL